jgi:hypothetical protein
VPPYFRRSDFRFCSHFQTPPRKEPSAFPAVLRKDNCVLFTDPIFREYRRYGSVFLRDAWKTVMESLAGKPAMGAGLPASVHVYPRYREEDLFLTLIHYIPVRKALEIDVIDERQGFEGMVLDFEASGKTLHDWETGRPLDEVSPGRWKLPPKKGRLLLSTSVRG